MTQIWPFIPRDELIEALEWRTDIIQAKSAEQRIAIREAPRRVFNMDHHLTEYEYTSAKAMMREAETFYVPDWAQSTAVGPVSPGSSVLIAGDFTDVQFGDVAVLWESLRNFEQVDITLDSNGATLATVVNVYASARLIPLWLAHCPEGLLASRSAGGIVQSSVAMNVYENTDLALSTYTQYRSLDVVPSCPIVAGGSFEESLQWPLSAFDNDQSIPEYIRQRTYPNLIFNMRWHLTTRAETYVLRQWLHSRRGRQKAFWLSSWGNDYEPAASILASTTLKIYALDGTTGLGFTGAFDIEIVSTAGVSYYRRVSVAQLSTPIGGRPVIDLTINSTLTLTLANIKRISILRCARFEADRIELLHQAAVGTIVAVPCIEIVEP
jgi:hypothetical protein